MTTARDVHQHPVTPDGDPIMGAKFRVAAIKPSVVRRSRLLNRLTEGAQGPLTLISAPAGSGKTVLANAWVASGAAPGPVTWIILDEDDDRSGIFWSYVLEGLARSGLPSPGVGLPHRVDGVGQSLLIRLAASLSEATEPHVLVLDNAERLLRHQVAEEIDFVLRHAAGHLRLVLLTRWDPELSLPQYRLEGSVTEIRFPELAFTLEEAGELLAGQAVHLSDGALAALVERTRGWAAGLRLAGPRYARTGEASDPSGVAGVDIAAYFRAEVLDPLPSDVRDFLVTTSVADTLLPGLAAHLTGSRSAPRLLRVLADSGGLIERVPGDDECYRYPPLVRDLLRAQLRLEAPARKRRLRRKAAQWLEEAGRPGEAVRQYAAARDWEDAAALLVGDLAVARMLADPPSVGLAEVFAGMPSGIPGPEAAAVAAALALLRLDLESCDKHLVRAGELVPQGPGDQARALRLAIAVTASSLAATNGDAEGVFSAATAAQEVLSGLAADGVEAPPETRALVLWSTGRSYLSAGELSAARVSLASAARAANAPGCEYLRARCLAHLALADALTGRLRRAAEFANRATGLCERRGVVAGPRPAAADVALAWVSAEQSDTHHGFLHADAAAAEIRHDPVTLGALALARGRLLRARGDLAGAVEAVNAARTGGASRTLPRWLANRLGAAEAVLLLAQGKPEAAIALVRKTAAAQEPEGMLASGWAVLPTGGAAEAGRMARQVLQRAGLPLDVRVDALLLTAACDLNTSRPEAAKAVMGQALRLAEPEHLHRPFEEAPIPLRTFIRGHKELTAGRLRWGADGTGARASSPGRPEGVGVIVQPLTEREQEVLSYLALLLPTEEIASRMFVSVNTVKTHVRSILRKLSAERRNEAVRRARELGLVS